MASAMLDQTWNLSQKGEEIITENNKITDKSTLLKNALNSDLKETGSPILGKYADKNSISQVVLQIQKIRNISAPKSNENSQTAPRMLKLVLTDGHTYIQAIEIAPISSLSHEHTPPGSKLLIRSAKIASGYILLDSNNCTLLGGKVPSLYEKWEVAKSVRYHNRNISSSDGAPVWVNFGRKIQADNVQDSKFTSLKDKNQQTAKENDKFDLQRQDAIAELTLGAVKKVFGGNTKQPTQEQISVKNRKVNDSLNKERKNYRVKPNKEDMDYIEPNQKPPERVSLFDFLEDKLPLSEPPKTNNSSFYANNNKSQTNTNYYSNAKPVNQKQYNVNYHQNQKQFHDGNNFNRQKNDNKFSERKPKENADVNAHGNNFNRQKNDNKFLEKKPKENADVNALGNSLGKMSINAQFASRSLKQHLNLEPPKKEKNVGENHNSGNPEWKIGDECVAKYWEDGKFYTASITGVTDKTCVVKFRGYGNMEEVLKTDCLPPKSADPNKKSYNSSAPTDFRKSRTYSRRPQF